MRSEALCGCGSDSKTLGIFSTAKKARQALRASTMKHYSGKQVYETCFEGSPKYPSHEQALKALLAAEKDAEEAFDFDQWGDGDRYTWSEEWEADGTGNVSATEAFEGCGSGNMYWSIDKRKLE